MSRFDHLNDEGQRPSKPFDVDGAIEGYRPAPTSDGAGQRSPLDAKVTDDLEGLTPVSDLAQRVIQSGEQVALTDDAAEFFGLKPATAPEDDVMAQDDLQAAMATVQENAPPTSRFTAMSSEHFNAMLDEVRAGGSIQNPGDAVDSEWLNEVADVFVDDDLNLLERS